jgi:NAD(P)-dependent dehydrogenase (short-subunit alcohol dehydrogenase family)
MNSDNNQKPEPVKAKWSTSDIPDLSGKTAIITGANSGTGFEASKALASKGAEVIMTCRTIEKGELAASKIKEEFPASILKVMVLDLADLSSVTSFSKEILEDYKVLHILCNNAGIMQTPQLKTKDGFELQFGTNHLGHFALTGQLLDLLIRTDGSRIVTVSSSMHRRGKMNFDDLMMEQKYGRASAYAQSKLANLLFTYNLQRLLEKNNHNTISVAAHPGYSATNLQSTGPGLEGGRFWVWLYTILNSLFAQSAAMGALPIIYAATSEDVKGGHYYGPGGFGGMRGYPKKVESSKESYDEEIAERLWNISISLTKTKYSLKRS